MSYLKREFAGDRFGDIGLPGSLQPSAPLPRGAALAGLAMVSAVALQGALMVACQLTSTLWLAVPCALLGAANLSAGALLIRGLGPRALNVIPLTMGILGLGAALF